MAILIRPAIAAVLVMTFVFTTSCITTSNTTSATDDPKNLSQVAYPDKALGEDNFKEWFTYYYRDPKPELTPYYMRFMSESGFIRRQPEMMMVFLSQVFKANPAKLTEWQKSWKGYDQYDVYVIWAALLLSKDAGAEKLAKAEIHAASEIDQKVFMKFMQEFAFEQNDITGMLQKPRYIKAIWGAFYATGDLTYVDRVIAIVPFYDAREGTVEFLAGKTALWSIAGNAVGHPMVLGHISKVSKAHPDNSVRAYLGAILEALFNAYEKQKREGGGKAKPPKAPTTNTGVEARNRHNPAPLLR